MVQSYNHTHPFPKHTKSYHSFSHRVSIDTWSEITLKDKEKTYDSWKNNCKSLKKRGLSGLYELCIVFSEEKKDNMQAFLLLFLCEILLLRQTSASTMIGTKTTQFNFLDKFNIHIQAITIWAISIFMNCLFIWSVTDFSLSTCNDD